MNYIRWFNELSIQDIPQVGGKNASLAELYRLLEDDNTQVPNGFAITANAYWDMIHHNQLDAKIKQLLTELAGSDTLALHKVGSQIRHLLQQAPFPPGLEQDLISAYESLTNEQSQDVAVRSSATAEDLPDASFAGQQESYLNVRGIDHLIDCCHRVFASLFTDRAISYREDKGFAHLDVALSIGVQQMVRSDLASSGVLFTLDTESGFRDLVMLTAAYGLGENIVQGAVNPDEFLVYKPTLKQGYRPIVKRQLGEKAIKMIYAQKSHHGIATRNINVSNELRKQFAITDDEVLQLANTACRIEQHYSEQAGHAQPMDIEWAKDGLSGQLHILQARPETVHSTQQQGLSQQFILKGSGPLLLKGKSVGQRIAVGKARIIHDASQMAQLQPGEILVTDITDPDWEPVMKIAAGIITNRGGRVCHAAIIARELGIPAVVGTGNGDQILTTGQILTLSCAEGDVGKVYEGALEFEVEEHSLEQKNRPHTKMMMNVADPDRAFEFSMLPNDGVGLARLEFIISHLIGMHPNALLDFNKLAPSLQQEINQGSSGYPNPVSFYRSRMSEGIGAIAAAFYPKPVILRFSDFKSNEYSSLLGGEAYEPLEENPMIGFRGTGRYPSEQFADCFVLECEAVKLVREQMGLNNLQLMLPFVRSTDDLDKALALMATQGLRRGENGLKVYTMCEIPANVVLAERFLERCDGYSIGSNDLTQLTLGVDRDSGLLSQYDERDEAVMRMMAMAITACKDRNKYVGICGQAPSDFPEITRWLVKQGIGSISLTPDSIIKMTELVLALEKEKKKTTSDW